MKHFAASIVLCFLVILVSSEAQPYYSRHYHYPGNQGAGGQGGGNYYGGCPPANCPAFCSIGMAGNGCPECLCIQN